MAEKKNMCVARNQQYRRGGLNKRERHNERKNADYQNEDIIKDRAALNVNFKQCEGMGYAATFDRMIAEGVISIRGLGKDPYIVDELVYDVNSAYFDNHGGYEYAKSFFEEAYRCAVEEIGGEQYVLSAVMHADERNSALSEQLGRDVFHYHLHVVYVPVVDKEIYFKKNNPDPEKAGKLREVIKQVSHSKKWPKLKQLDENGEVKRNAKGKAVLLNSYALLQDHFFQHMREHGFDGFERGERGSTAENLSVLQYKTKQERERAVHFTAIAEGKKQTAAALDTAIGEKKDAAAELDKQTAKKQKQLDALTVQVGEMKKVAATVAEVEKMGTPTMFGGNFTVTGNDMKKLKSLAVEGVKSRGIIADLRKRVTDFMKQVADLTKDLNSRKVSVKDELGYFSARQRAPRRLAEVIADIMRKPAERNEQQHTSPDRKRGHGMEH